MDDQRYPLTGNCFELGLGIVRNGSNLFWSLLLSLGTILLKGGCSVTSTKHMFLLKVVVSGIL
jgi:hypothetical protein